MTSKDESKSARPYILARAIADSRVSPGILVFTSSRELIYSNRAGQELNSLINRINHGRTAIGVLSPEVSKLCDQIRQMLEISTDPKDWENIKVPRIAGDRKRPVLLSGLALPHPKGIEETRILILMEEIGRRKERSAEYAKDYYELTVREQAVIYRLLEGMTNKEIAKELGIAEQTTKDHIENIMKKMKVSTRTGILAKIFRPDHDSGF